MATDLCVPAAIHEFPEDVFTKEQRNRGAVLLHVLCVSTEYSQSTHLLLCLYKYWYTFSVYVPIIHRILTCNCIYTSIHVPLVMSETAAVKNGKS